MPVGYTNFYGYYFADLLTANGIIHRRFASTEFNSEPDSPFLATEADPMADLSHSSDNVTINIFLSSSVVVETIFDDTKVDWGLNNDNVLINCKIGFLYDGTMLFEDGSPMLFENGILMIYE